MPPSDERVGEESSAKESPTQIIVTHDTADFDAFAAAVAAQKLYPEAVIVLGRTLGPAVRDFYSLHKDRFPVLRYQEIDQAKVKLLVAVDVRRCDRLRDYGLLLERIDSPTEGVEVHVYDHHASSDRDLPADRAIVDRVGSATTLLVEEIRMRAVTIDRVEATLFALGIHMDTGSLLHGTTTARDADAIAWLLNAGASLAMINRYMRLPMSPRQRQVLSQLLSQLSCEEIHGIGLAHAVVELERGVDGLAGVVSEALDLDGRAAMMVVFAMRKKRIQVVARARSNLIDVAAIVSSVGGGGHRSAASAAIKGREPAEVLATLLAAYRANPPRPSTVGDLMSSPVHTVRSDTSLADMKASLVTWRHTGAPVVRDGRIVGMISRRDVENADRHDRLSLPVSSCMAHDVVCTSADVPLDQALAKMVEADVGRLPVLRGRDLIGIITRSDVLRAVYAG